MPTPCRAIVCALLAGLAGACDRPSTDETIRLRVHEGMVAACLTPLEALHAATAGCARILGAEGDLGTIEPGKWADLVPLDADPTADIRNTRRIRAVLQAGRLLDRGT